MRLFAVLFRFVVVGVVTLLLSSCAAKKAYTVKLVNVQVGLKTSARWSEYSWRGSTAIELTRSRETPKGKRNEAHVVIFTERRRDQDEAVMRLGEIAAESKVRSTFLLIDGWPALQRRQTVTVPRPGGVDDDDAGPEMRVVQVTTAVAANGNIVRSEGSVPLDVDSSIVTEVEKIGRSFTFAPRPTPSESKDALQRLSKADQQRLRNEKEQPTVTTPQALSTQIKHERRHTMPGAPSPVGGGPWGELEVAASKDGQHVVVAAQSATTLFSDDGGLTFKTSVPNLPSMIFTGGNHGDPSIAIGASGAFYVSFLSTPGGACAASVMSSAPNNGATFTFDANAVLCPAVGDPKCFPDQEHIAADPLRSSGGNDQIYLVYRQFTSVGGGNCPLGNYFYPFPSITCSADNGKTWLPPRPIAAGDLARVTVGGDEFVWVVQRSSDVITVSKFSSCETGLEPQPGFPRKVVSVSDPFCPVPGLDRCSGDALSSAMIAVDQTDPTHIFIAYANSTSSANDDILVTDTTDAFATAPANLRTVTVSGADVGRRYMPWVCTLGASAEVAWYDRRAGAAPTATRFDRTDYFRGSASIVNTTQADGSVVANLASGAEVNVSGVSDPQCAPGFACGARSADDVKSCPRPHNDGTCKNSSGTGSGKLCDRDLGGCPPGEACFANGTPPDYGCPKYGDYNGTACAAGHVFAAWASATPPAGLPAPGGIGLFVDALNCGGPGEACCPSGSSCHTGLTCSATSVCSAPDCGGVGQACCGGNSCVAGSGCLSGICATCPTAPRTLVDTTVQAGADCAGNTQVRDFGTSACDPGFVGTCSVTRNSEDNGSQCIGTSFGGCTCHVIASTPKDCGKWVTCRVVVTEQPPGPIPTGCQAP
jgi:hypothetical protein